MEKITYTEVHEVRLGSKLIGHIRAVKENEVKGYRYYPKGYSTKHAGDFFERLHLCKHSLEHDPE
jgi:hypothetical protein